MTVDLVAERETLAASLSGVERGLRVYAYVPDKPEPPCAIVYPAADQYVDYHDSFDGAATIRFRILVLLSAASDRQGQEQMDRLLSSGVGDSLVDVIETDRRVQVRDVSHQGTVSLDADSQTWVYAGELSVEVLAVR